VSDWYPDYFQFLKATSFARPGPANTWLFVDEHPDSINDGWLIPDVTDSSRFVVLLLRVARGYGSKPYPRSWDCVPT